MTARSTTTTTTSTINAWDGDAPRAARDATRGAHVDGVTTTGVLRRLLRYVARHRRDAALTAAFGTTGFLLSFAYPWIIGAVVDLVVGRGGATTFAARQAALFRLTELAGATALLHAAVVYGRGHFNIRLTDGIIADLRRDLFDHLQTLSLSFYTRARTGGLLARVLHDVHEATALIYAGLLVAALDAAQLAIAAVLLAGISWKLTLACVGLFPLYGLVFAAMNPRVRRASERVHAQFCQISGDVAEQIAGQAVVKTYTAEQREAERFAASVARHHGLVVAQSHEGHLVAGAGEVLVHLGTTIVVGLGGWLALRGELTPGMMTRFLGYMVVLFGPVRRFAELNVTYQTSLAAMRRVFRVLDVQPAIVEPAGAHVEPPTRGHVRFEDVSFRYADERDDDRDEDPARLDDTGPARRATPDARWVLDGVSLDAAPGERVAVVGRSGAGKTTLLSLLPRLYDADRGRVLVDGVDVRHYALTALRAAIGIVQQESFMFTGTIRDNIAYGRPGAPDDAVERAARAAHAHEFIATFPEGYRTRLGERGVNLSGGQRQRLSIARALLKDPRILILDEATSSLDAESERVVQRALEALMHGRTCFVIAHRLSTIRSADRILVLEGGRIVESGTHRELVARGGAYARLLGDQAAIL